MQPLNAALHIRACNTVAAWRKAAMSSRIGRPLDEQLMPTSNRQENFMSNVQATNDDVRLLDSTSADWRTSKSNTSKIWHWYDPPVIFPIGLTLLIVGYVLARAPL
jgi:hypothetical protein